jgi:Flp pilus assembly protein TadD
VGVVLFAIANSAILGVRTVNRAAEEARLGDVLLRSGDSEAGLAALERSFGLDSTRTVTAYLLARANLAEGRPREAVRYFQRVFLARPEDSGVGFELGVALLEAGEFQRASWVFERTVALDKTNASAWVNLGVAYEEQGLVDRALAAYREGTKLAPGAETGLVRYAGLLLKEGRAPEAIRLLEGATTRLPRSFDLRFSLAVARAAAADSVRAREEANRALNLRPRDPRALSLLRALTPATP